MTSNNDKHPISKIIGITGGVGSGKSTVIRMIQEMKKTFVILTDEVAHELMEPNREGFQKVIENFGTDILDEKGQIDRKHLATLVFEDRNKLKLLNGIIHPLVMEEVKERITIGQSTDHEVIIIETALYKEAGLQELCDQIWYIRTSPEIRKMWLMKNRSYSEEKIRSIMSNQAADSEYEQISDRVIVNCGDIKILQQQLVDALII